MTGSVTFTPTEADYVAAIRANFVAALRRKRTIRNGAVVILGAAMFFGLIGAREGIASVPAYALGGLVYGAVMWGLILMLSLALLPRRARRRFRQQRTIHRQFEYRWTEEALGFTSAIATGSVPWSEFLGFRETSAAFLLYLHDGLFEFVPRAALSEADARDLRATLARSGLPVY